MKKKQLAKLKQQFRPSYEMARQQLFSAIQHKTAANFGLETTVYINPKNREEMLIELQTATTKEQKNRSSFRREFQNRCETNPKTRKRSIRSF